jgi:hypothetical protein
MRIKHYSSLIFLFTILIGCKKLDLLFDVPDCIEKEIGEFAESPFACDSNAQVLRYDFQDSQVFLFQPGNCGADLSEKVYDCDCNLICTLGGLEGNNICDSLDFNEYATNKVIVWKNQ